MVKQISIGALSHIPMKMIWGTRGRGFESRHSDHKKLFHRLVKELFVFHGVTGFEQPALATAGHKQSSGLFARVRENPRPFAA